MPAHRPILSSSLLHHRPAIQNVQPVQQISPDPPTINTTFNLYPLHPCADNLYHSVSIMHTRIIPSRTCGCLLVSTGWCVYRFSPLLTPHIPLSLKVFFMQAYKRLRHFTPYDMHYGLLAYCPGWCDSLMGTDSVCINCREVSHCVTFNLCFLHPLDLLRDSAACATCSILFPPPPTIFSLLLFPSLDSCVSTLCCFSYILVSFVI